MVTLSTYHASGMHCWSVPTDRAGLLPAVRMPCGYLLAGPVAADGTWRAPPGPVLDAAAPSAGL